jgi:hypothetical protein
MPEDYRYIETIKPPIDKLKAITCPNQEIIQVGEKIIDYPLDKFDVCKQDFKKVTEHTPNHPDVKYGDYCLNTVPLQPPIIIQLPDGFLEHAKNMPTIHGPELLTKDELAYFKDNGKNAFIFIHGFDVSPGAYQNQIIGFEKKIRSIPLENKPPEGILDPSFSQPLSFLPQSEEILFPLYNQSKRTIYSGISALVLNPKFPKEELQKQPAWGLHDEGPDDTYSPMNGSGAHLWFTHMEENLNMATQQFLKEGKRDYMKYTRLLNVIWRGDVGTINYMDSEYKAIYAGCALVPLLQQLIDAKIEVNILAHSMGNRVAFVALNELGNKAKYKDKYHGKINHVFSWDAALPSSVLSADYRKDTSKRENCYFPYLMDIIKKMTVLYNEKDSVLSFWYKEANHLAVSGYEPPIERALEGETLPEYQKRILDCNDLMPAQKTAYHASAEEIMNTMPRTPRVGVLPALGLVGPMPEKNVKDQDPFIQKLWKDKRLFIANMTPYAAGHSYMKVPNKDIMEHGYKGYILNQEVGITKFGNYDSSLFKEKKG